MTSATSPDSSKFAHDGWKTVSLREGLRRTSPSIGSTTTDTSIGPASRNRVSRRPSLFFRWRRATRPRPSGPRRSRGVQQLVRARPGGREVRIGVANTCRAGHAVGVRNGTVRSRSSSERWTSDPATNNHGLSARTALAIMMVGARPIFADIDAERDDPIRRPSRARDHAAHPRFRSICGQAADVTAIRRTLPPASSRHYGRRCQAHLATGNRPVGRWHRRRIRLLPTKILSARRRRRRRDQRPSRGAVAHPGNGGQRDQYHHQEPGVNSRLDELQAAVLSARLPLLPGWTKRRRALAASYRTALAAASIGVPKEMDAGHVYHLFVIRVEASAGRDRRGDMQRHLAARGIETLVHYPVPIPRQPALAAAKPDDCPRASAACAEVLSLPLHPALTAPEVDRIATAVAEFS